MADPAPPPPASEKKKKLLNGPNIEYKYPSGSVYVGGFKDGKLHGIGRYKYHPSGDVYEGEWLSDMKHGHGIYTYDGGDTYTGEWRAGKKHGKGTYVFASGDEYVGAWADDKIHGFGVFLIARNGNRYEGNWEESYRQGHGVLTSGNGDVYDGLWVRGKEEGLGIFTYANGNVYCGDWKAGAMDGKGILVERGQKHTVEHIAGYLISKVPIDDDVAVDEGWAVADRAYRGYRKRKEGAAAAAGGAGGGAGGVGGGGAGGGPDNTQALVKAQLEAATWKKRYEEVLAQKTEGLLAGEPTDLAGLQKRVAALKVAHDAEKNRAEIAVSHAKLLEAEVDQVKNQLKNAELNAANGGGGGGDGADESSVAENERLRIKVAELTKELDLRKKAQGGSPAGGASGATGSAIDTNDPVELKVRLELAEGELKNLREKREEVYKLREQTMDNMKTIQRLETRNEELLKEINVHRARTSNLQGQINDSTSRQFAELSAEITELKKIAEEATKAKAEAEAVASKARKGEQLANIRITDLEGENARLNKRYANTDTDLNKNLDKKMDQVESLKKQNADLQRQNDELQYDLAKAKRDAKKNKGGKDDDFALDAGAAGGAAGDVEQLQSDLKKEKKKYKKAVSERDAIAQELYNEQLLTTRLSRAMDTLTGRIAVLAAIDNHTDLENEKTVLRINQENPAEIFIYENGAPAAGEAGAADEEGGGKKSKKSKKAGASSSAVEFDACIDSAQTMDDLYDELKNSLRFTTEGFHTALVTVGPMSSGKSHVVTNVAPKLFKGIFETAAANQSKVCPTFSTVFKVGALEVAHNGIFDLVSGGEIMSVVRGGSLEVVAVGETFTEVKDENDALRLFNELRAKKRKTASGRSHFIFHTIVEVRHRVQNVVKTGKFTIADLCGQGALADQENDVESARYVNTTSKSLSSVFETLIQTKDSTTSPSVPYSANSFAMLLSDLFGGNCITTVVACASATNKETITESAASLRLAAQLREVYNRPILQNQQTPDVSRLRQLVKDHVDSDQSVPAMQEVTNIRM